MSFVIAADKRGCQESIFLISPQKRILWYSLEVPQQGTSNEYYNICFCGEIRKISKSFVGKSTLSEAMNVVC